MTPTTLSGGRPALSTNRIRGLAWPWGPVILSRLLALGAGAAGSGLWGWAAGWQAFDRAGLTKSFGRVGDVLAGGVVRWDSIHYLQIASYGYRPSWVAFFPLYPLAIKVLGFVLRSDTIAGALISIVSFFVGLVLLHRITREQLGARAADATVVLLAFAPLSFFFTALYTESLFLALCVGTFYAAQRERWLVACVCAAGATITRVPGILLVAPVAMMWWSSRQRSSGQYAWRALRTWRTLLYLCLPAVTLLGFLLYMRVQGFGFLAPFRDQTTQHQRAFGTPIVTIARAVAGAWGGVRDIFAGEPVIEPTVHSPFSHGPHDLFAFLVLLIAVAALVQVWRKLPRTYAVYATLVMLACTWTAAKEVPLEAFDRYALTMFPLWMAAADWLVRRRLLYPVVLISAVCLCFYAVEFGRWVTIG